MQQVARDEGLALTTLTHQLSTMPSSLEATLCSGSSVPLTVPTEKGKQAWWVEGWLGPRAPGLPHAAGQVMQLTRVPLPQPTRPLDILQSARRALEVRKGHGVSRCCLFQEATLTPGSPWAALLGYRPQGGLLVSLAAPQALGSAGQHLAATVAR